MKKIATALQKSALRKARKGLRKQMLKMFEEDGITLEQMEKLAINFLGKDFKNFLENDREYQDFKAKRANRSNENEQKK